MNKNHYELLEIPSTASIDQIKRAYRRLAKMHHPDIAPNETETFQRINNAYMTLIDSNERKKYDQTLKKGAVHISSSHSSQNNSRTNTNRYFERVTLINATKSIWAVNIIYAELLQGKEIIIENPEKPYKKIKLKLDPSTHHQGCKWIVKNQGIIGGDITLVANILHLAAH